MKILGIETSCDETGISIYDSHFGIIINQLHSQSKLHANYGGIVPELASRQHLYNTIQLIEKSLNKSNLKIKDIDRIAYTAGPGLVGSLIIGATIGKSLSYIHKIPAIAVHHMEGHLLTPMMENKKICFPSVALLVSGGHTQIVFVSNLGKYKIIGKSIDNSVGETFDKIAKLLGIKYPGGRKLSSFARRGRPNKYIFPKPMINRSDLLLSFSGLRTFVTNIIQKSNKDMQTKADIAYAFEDTITEILAIKCKLALQLNNCKNLIIAGGVSSNFLLRKKIKKIILEMNGKMFCASPRFCTDNGAMIAHIGEIRKRDAIEKDLRILVKPNWSIEELKPIL